jgi:hypothetical protein
MDIDGVFYAEFKMFLTIIYLHSQFLREFLLWALCSILKLSNATFRKCDLFPSSVKESCLLHQLKSVTDAFSEMLVSSIFSISNDRERQKSNNCDSRSLPLNRYCLVSIQAGNGLTERSLIFAISVYFFLQHKFKIIRGVHTAFYLIYIWEQVGRSVKPFTSVQHRRIESMKLFPPLIFTKEI